ncbi:NB-ARC and TPR domain protein [Pyrenophora teres f. maculata]|nr:NB-ARC and TPR domain protein [Pyrenophora teres f. maculata]
MAEPFSTVAAGIALLSNLKHLYVNAKDLKDSIKSVHDDIDALQKELLSVQELSESIEQLRGRLHRRPSSNAEQMKQLVGLSKPLESMSADIRLCHLKLRDVYGANPKRGAWKSFKKRNKYKDVEPAIHTLRSSISNNREKIMIWMQSINIGKLDFVYEDFMIKLTNLEKSNEAAKALTHNVKRNEHFAIPKAVESHYLGRDIELSELEEAFWPKTPVQCHQQKRYVVYGVGGSGKTQFCGKYAQEFRNRYWGVFCIDGASEDRLKSSLISDVAEKGGVGKNHEAALHWLSNQDEDWLLIIDNADNQNVDLVEFFPQGANGHVLTTTRNKDCTYDNIGSMAFSGMHESDGNELLVRVAKATKSPENKQHMSDILKELGYLALAVVVACSTIHQGYCTLENYLTYLQRVWRGKLSERKSSGWSDNSEKAREGRVDAQFDLSLLAIKDRRTQAIKRCDTQDEIASKDAPELLKTFAYMHREKIRFKFLKQADILRLQYYQTSSEQPKLPVNSMKVDF